MKDEGLVYTLLMPLGLSPVSMQLTFPCHHEKHWSMPGVFPSPKCESFGTCGRCLSEC